MGFFELTEPKSLNEKQFRLIVEHLNLVQERKHSFCNWLEGACEVNSTQKFDEAQTQKVLEKLRAEFLNVIDKSYPKHQQAKLQKAHTKDSTPPKFEAFC